MLKVTQFQVGGFDNNLSYTIHDDATRECFIVDPTGDLTELTEFLIMHSLTVTGILLTHTHPDHHDRLMEILGSRMVPVYVHERGVGRLTAPQLTPIGEGSALTLGAHRVSVLYTPGHNRDSVCCAIADVDAADGVPQLITGDTLFVHGCGRTDRELVGSLFDSLQRLKSLAPETVIYPGHDYGPSPTSTIAEELNENRFLRAETIDAFIIERLE